MAKLKILLNQLLIRFTIAFFIFVASVQVSAQKTDTIVHINGNIMTGDFKKMVYGVVTWKMDGMGTISLEEPNISTIISKKQFEIKMKSEKMYFGSFEASKENRMVYLKLGEERKLVRIEDIVEIYPIKRGFFMRTSGKVSLGLNYSKGSQVATLAFSGNLNYRKQKTYFDLVWGTNNTYQGDTLTGRKSDISLTWQRSLARGWSTNISIAASQNLELGTKLRKSLNLTGIKDLAYNRWNRLYLGMGLNLAQETPFGNSDMTNDIAGLFTLNWKVFKLSNPKLWVDADISYLPYFTDNRNRFNFNLNPQVSIFSNNFKIGLNFYYTYDSQPTTQSGSNDDYGLNMQLTYYYN